MIYDDDQCDACGAARVSGSRLCAGCLLRVYNNALKRELEMVKDNKDLERKVIKLTELCERLLDHITNNSVYTGELEQAIYSTWLKNWKEGQNEKGRVHDNK